MNLLSILNPNDIIDFVAPSRDVPEKTLQEITQYFHEQNLQVSFGENMQGEDLFCSNNDAARFEHLKNALLNPYSKVIWSIAGGYGSARLIPYLEKMPKPSVPKLFIGLSDVTALHIFFNQRWDWITLHGPGARCAVYQPIDPDCFKQTFDLLYGKKSAVNFSLQPLNKKALEIKELPAKVCGGNLSIVQTSCGTDWQIDARDKIILLEDVGERPYRIDRMLVQLQQAHVLKNAAAVLFADFTNCGSSGEKATVDDVLKRFAEQTDAPVYRCEGIGHGHKNYSLFLNKEMKIQARDGEFQLLGF